MADEEVPPTWQSLLLPPGVGAPLPPPEPASYGAHVDLGGMFPVDTAFITMAKRQFWLSTVHDGRVNLQGGWTAIDCPKEVFVLMWHDDPGVALVNADGAEASKYLRRSVRIDGNRRRVSLPSAAYHRLQIAGDDEQILMAQAGMFLVLLNPHWAAQLDFWDKMNRKPQ